MENITLTGIDIAKDVFEVRSVNHVGRLVRRKRARRDQLESCLRELPKGSIVAMEACGGSHYWGRKAQEIGLEVKLIPPQFVTSHRKSQKNDKNDAEAICKAAVAADMRFVSLKSQEQLDIQMLHRIREQFAKEKTAVINQIRAFLSERGVVFPVSVVKFLSGFKEYRATLDEGAGFTKVVDRLYSHLQQILTKLDECTNELEALAKDSKPCRKLLQLRGVGVLTATACLALVGKATDYTNGRSFSASLGLVPRQFSSGNRKKLGSITKRGDRYIRQLLVHGARSVVSAAVRLKKNDPLSLWIRSLHERYGTNHTAVALANKNARHIWATLAGKTPRPIVLPDDSLTQAA